MAHSVPGSVPDDGRNLDPALGSLSGEGAQIEVGVPEVAWPIAVDARPTPDRPPSETYYDLPAIKPAPWKWYIPTYFHAGGLAGAAASLAGALRLAGGPRTDTLERRLHWIAVLGEATGGALLIADLGRPARFHHMMRVFRPTSPMNMGTWILMAASASGGLALLESLLGRRPGRIASTVAAVAGSGLSTYTGVLLGNTSVPLWNVTRRRLPPWFAAASAASLGSLLELLGVESREVRIYSAIGKAAHLAGARLVERAAESAGVGAPLHEGRSGTLWKAATWLGAASLVATLWPSGGRTRAAIAGGLGTAAAVLARFAITEAGHASAADPRATFEPQRRGAREAGGRD
jgi:formate-dependent nitrite reductase membrane component NrfD